MNDKVVVKGEKADPFKIMERIHKKYPYRNVQLLTPLAGEAKEDEVAINFFLYLNSLIIFSTLSPPTIHST